VPDMHASRKPLGTLANDQPRSMIPERGVRFQVDASGHERTRLTVEGVAKG